MSRKFYIVIFLSILYLIKSPFLFAQTISPKATMLILGSANPKTLQHRVEIAYRLYSSDIVFNRIIVSGGCGAHSSSICEASRMDSLLTAKGIPKVKIFKEEKSMSTKQNYCYSKKLTNNGRLLIRKNNPLYVVSDHWHAIPVASCFRNVAGITSTNFHIDGTINPKGPVDYTSIFKECRKNNYCRNILWAFVDAAYFDRDLKKVYYFVDNIYYRKTPGKNIDAGYPKRISQFPGWPEKWNEHVDAAYYIPKNHQIYLFKGTELVSINTEKPEKLQHRWKINQYFKKWPASWDNGYIDGAYYNEENHKLYLFKNSSFLRYHGTNKDKGFPAKIETSFLNKWPFQWGTGDLDAAYYDPFMLKTNLFRGTKYFQFSKNEKMEPIVLKNISIPWPTAMWGGRP